MNTLKEFAPGIILGSLLTILSFALFADIAVNGTLATPAKTFTALAIVGVALLATNAVTWIVMDGKRDRQVSDAVNSVNAQHAAHNARIAAESNDWHRARQASLTARDWAA